MKQRESAPASCKSAALHSCIRAPRPGMSWSADKPSWRGASGRSGPRASSLDFPSSRAVERYSSADHKRPYSKRDARRASRKQIGSSESGQQQERFYDKEYTLTYAISHTASSKLAGSATAPPQVGAVSLQAVAHTCAFPAQSPQSAVSAKKVKGQLGRKFS